jgi:hypothetical protein
MSGTDFTTTPNLGLYKPVYDQDAEAWGTHLNANADVLDGALATSGASAKFLPLSGGTMLGGLTLAADPSTALGAVTKQYADAHLFTDAANDANTYGRHANAWSAVVPLSGAAMTGLLTLSGAPSATLHAANKGYVDTFLPLAGGTLTGPLTISQTAGIVGTTTNNNASVGAVGEYVSSVVAAVSAVPLTNNVAANVTSISLTAGDWDVRGDVSIQPAATTSMVTANGGINTVSATIPTVGVGPRFYLSVAFPTGVGTQMSLASFRISIAATTTVYLVALAAFTVSTCAAFGYIGARRIR